MMGDERKKYYKRQKSIDKKLIKKAEKVASTTAFKRDMYPKLGVSHDTFHAYLTQYSEFSEAINRGEETFLERINKKSNDLIEQLLTIGRLSSQEILDRDGQKQSLTKIEQLTLKEILELKAKIDPKTFGETLPQEENISNEKVDFKTFMERGGYPIPFDKQVEAYEFFKETDEPSMILGSRGYGKTDYITIGGVAYEIYLDPVGASFLIITKSDERNKAIIKEIESLLISNGMDLKENNSKSLRVNGQQGKDPSVGVITLKSASFRGRHPRMAIFDDPVTPEDVSEATRKLAKRVYEEVNKLTDRILIIGQPVHTLDLYEELRKIEGFRKMELPWGSIPELDPDLEAQKMAGVSEESISASYHLKVINETPMPFENIKTLQGWIGGETVAFIDPSFTGGDYTAISIGRAYMDGIAIVGFAWKKSWDSLMREFQEVVAKYKIKKICFETNSLGTMPLNILRAELNIPIVGKVTTVNKHAKIVSAGLFSEYIHLSNQSNKAYNDQVRYYEFRAKNDDAPDSLSSLLKWLGVVRGL